MVFIGLMLLSIVSAGVICGYCSFQAQKARGGDREIGAALALLAAILAGSWGWYFIAYQSDDRVAARTQERVERNAKEQCESRTGANYMAREFVKDRIKTPSTAKFASYSESRVEPAGKCKFVVQSYVDSQNSFGANVRTHYSAIMEYVPDIDRWKLITIDFE